LDKPTNALSWARKPAAFTELIEVTQRLFEDRGFDKRIDLLQQVQIGAAENSGWNEPCLEDQWWVTKVP
jgi:hypothetical protein